MSNWYKKIPHPVVMLFGMIVFATVLSYILPAGAFERELVNGRQRVIPGSFKSIASTPVSFLNMFTALSRGFKAAADIIFVVFAGGIMFGILDKTKMIENTIGTIVKTMGLERKYLIVLVMTYVFGLMGILIGYENNIALVPIAAVLSIALGGDLILAAGISVGAITVGFGLSPINPYTVGIGHQIAELPIFSGAIFRSILCFTGLSLMAYYNIRYFKKITSNSNTLGQGLETQGFALSKPLAEYKMSANNYLILSIFLGGLVIMLYGIFKHGWYLNQISAIFIIIAVVAGMANRMSGQEMSETILKSISLVAPGAFMVGYATTIKVILEMGNVSDTIAFNLASMLEHLPTYGSALCMSLSQCLMNLLIPSGSGQALATLPIMIPVGELVGLTRQTSILAFQIGDGVTNLFNPTLGGLIAMLGLCRVPFDRWLKYIMPIALIILAVSWVALIIAVAIGYS